MKSLIFSFIFFVYLVSLAFANGAGNEITKIVNGFSFEFGMENKELKANDKAIMSLIIHNATTGEILEIENLWIRISKGDEILFTASDFKTRKDGGIFFGYTFKESGNYTIDFSFKQDNKNINTDFNVGVKGSNQNLLKNTAALIAMFILGYLTAKFLSQKINRRFKNEK